MRNGGVALGIDLLCRSASLIDLIVKDLIRCNIRNN